MASDTEEGAKVRPDGPGEGPKGEPLLEGPGEGATEEAPEGELPSDTPEKGKAKASRLKRFLLWPLAAIVILLGAFWLSLGLFPDPMEQGAGWDWTMRVTDREGRVLREFLSPSMSKRDFVPLPEVSPYLVAAVLAAEDKRFRHHPGFDPLAFARAAWTNGRAGKIVSGGSTITMQLARLGKGLSPGPRTYGRKLSETWAALLIERHHSKDEILESYINLVPMGRLNSGFESAARMYLGKGIRELSPSEAAFLAALPASPGSFDPYRHFPKAVARRDDILKRMRDQGAITGEALERALSETVALNHSPPPYLAPHFVARIAQMLPAGEGEIRTTLDLSLQQELEAMASETVENNRAQGLEQVSVIVMGLPEREILAWVGSGDFHAEKDGQLDGVLAPRQPGSALKPFIYALAFDTGRLTASTRMSDAPRDFQGRGEVFSPRNYSGLFSAQVSARQALASSLNVPAVILANEVGVGNVLSNLRGLGLETLDRDAAHYGLGLALGDGEVSLLSLATAYAMLGDGGILAQPVYFPGQSADTLPKRALSQEAAFLVSDILADDLARGMGFGYDGILNTPYPSSVKTGTSSNFRDNWCIGYTDRYVVGVWAGNFAAQPMTKISGITGAGQLWRKAMDLLAERAEPKAPIAPSGIRSIPVCPVSGLPAGPDCPTSVREWFLAKFPIPAECDHLHLSEMRVLGASLEFGLISPLPREIYAYDPGLPPEQQRLRALAQSVPEVTELVWILNGRELARTKTQGYGRSSFFLPLEKGGNRLELIGIRGGEEAPLKASASYSVK
ncbi:MAG: penicillin-binding protein 1C [Deltaproteobacteria bacterium]|jgi:penicillin-binding protein 1C|nr:penicillin-binding protein 1C [Deltaproteobacteria bacterium]